MVVVLGDRNDAMSELLGSWRHGAVRAAIAEFLAQCAEVDPADRLAVFDNDGTLWCEKPAYPQLAFFVHELQQAVAADVSLASRAEYAALLGHDRAAIEALGLPRIGMALLELFAGWSPERFAERSRAFLLEAPHPTLARPFAKAVYQPMLELVDALRAHGFSVGIVSGGGTEFVRSVSRELYGVEPEAVVGSFVGYRYVDGPGRVGLVRTAELDGEANEGAAKVFSIQQHLGRRPVFAAGNSAGDREMLDWAVSGEGPSLALLVDHDDEAREFAYESVAGTFASDERIVDVGRASGWVVASMASDWERVFPA
jgi:phosphoserine phosphatase